MYLVEDSEMGPDDGACALSSSSNRPLLLPFVTPWQTLVAVWQTAIRSRV